VFVLKYIQIIDSKLLHDLASG